MSTCVPVSLFTSLRVDALDRPRERNRLADVFDAAQPRDDALDAHAESRVGNGAVLAQFQIPLERFLW